MRTRGRTDANQIEIVKKFRDCGASVLILSSLGNGYPDVLIGWRNGNYLLEIKDGDKVPSAQQLTADEKKFFESWAGQVDKVSSFDEAWEAILRRAN